MCARWMEWLLDVDDDDLESDELEAVLRGPGGASPVAVGEFPSAVGKVQEEELRSTMIRGSGARSLVQ